MHIKLIAAFSTCILTIFYMHVYRLITQERKKAT